MPRTKSFTTVLLIKAKYWKQVYSKLCKKVTVKKNRQQCMKICNRWDGLLKEVIRFPGMSNDQKKWEEKKQAILLVGMVWIFYLGSQAFLDFFSMRKQKGDEPLWWASGPGQVYTAGSKKNGVSRVRPLSAPVLIPLAAPSLSLPICRMEIMTVSTSSLPGWEI